jgi:hypothetical protein
MGDYTPRPSPYWLPTSHLGFSPFPLFRYRERRRGKKGGEKEGCAAARALPRRPERRSGTRAGAAVPWRRELCESKEPKPRERRRLEHLRHRE